MTDTVFSKHRDLVPFPVAPWLKVLNIIVWALGLAGMVAVPLLVALLLPEHLPLAALWAWVALVIHFGFSKLFCFINGGNYRDVVVYQGWQLTLTSYISICMLLSFLGSMVFAQIKLAIRRSRNSHFA